MRTTTSRPRPGLRNSRSLAAALAALVAVGGLGWYLTDRHGDAGASAAAPWCDERLKGSGIGDQHLTLMTGAHQGLTAEIVSAGFRIMLCVSDGGSGTTQPVDPAPMDVPARTVMLDTSGTSGMTGRQGTAYVTGFAGDDVRSVTVTDQGRTSAALLRDHRFLAWWPVRQASAPGLQDDKVTVTFTDGTSRIVTVHALPTLLG